MKRNKTLIICAIASIIGLMVMISATHLTVSNISNQIQFDREIPVMKLCFPGGIALIIFSSLVYLKNDPI